MDINGWHEFWWREINEDIYHVAGKKGLLKIRLEVGKYWRELLEWFGGKEASFSIIKYGDDRINWYRVYAHTGVCAQSKEATIVVVKSLDLLNVVNWKEVSYRLMWNELLIDGFRGSLFYPKGIHLGFVLLTCFHLLHGR